MIINELIMKFIRVVEAGWIPLLEGVEAAEASDLRGDWLQFHWELLVEGRLQDEGNNICLFAYGSGADTANGRIFPPREAPLYGVFCKPRIGDRLLNLLTDRMVKVPPNGYLVEHFANGQTGYYSLDVPLNSVVIDHSHNEEPILLRIIDVDFYLVQMKSYASNEN